MVVLSAISRIITSFAVYLYPSYATYKTIAHNGNPEEVKSWLVYWCVVGVFAAFETSLEWLVNWVILYTEIKSLFLVFLSQGGASILYHGYLAPQYAHYEPNIDAHLAKLKTQTYAYVQEQLQTVYKALMGSIGVAQNDPVPSTPNASASTPYSTPHGTAPGNANGGTAAADLAQNLWNSYGKNVLSAGTNYFQNKNGHPSSSSSRDAPTVVNNASASASSFEGYTVEPTIKFPEPDTRLNAGIALAARVPLPHSSSNLTEDWKKTE